MMVPRFSHVSARTVPEALDALARHGDRARVIAGGTDLVPKLLRGQLRPEIVVGLGHIDELRVIRFEPSTGLSVGALARIADVLDHPAVRRHYPALVGALGQMATVPIRNMGTLGGNLCNASPCADSGPTLLVRGARVLLCSVRGERRLDLASFLTGPGVTAREPDELMSRIEVPPPPPETGFAYHRISARSRVDMAAASAAAKVTMDGDRCAEARIVMGSCGPTALRARRAEALLTGQALTEERIREAGRLAAGESQPITDVRASAEWRRLVLAVLVQRAITQAVGRAREVRS